MFNIENTELFPKFPYLEKTLRNHELNNSQLACFALDKKTISDELQKYNFKSRINCGSTILVGEGNFSFSVALCKRLKNDVNLITSTYESFHKLSELGKLNSEILRRRGARVFHKLDATQLHCLFRKNSFDTVIFNFPHSGSREGANGENSTFVLTKNFISSSIKTLKKDGIILITVVDSEYYTKVFKFTEIAKELNLKEPKKYKFSPADYSGYIHSMTHLNESGIDDYSKFVTIELRV